MNELVAVLCVSSGAVCGALTRYKITQVAKKYDASVWSTMSINIAGSFVLGGLVSKQQLNSISKNNMLLWGTGFCGSLTTFSTFAVDFMMLIQSQQISKGLLLLTLTNGASISAASLGYILVKKLSKF